MRKVALFVVVLCVAGSALGQDRAVRISPPVPAGKPQGTYAAGFAMTPWQLALGYQYNRVALRGVFPPFKTNGISESVTRYFGPFLGVEGTVGIGFGSPVPGVSAKTLFAGAGPRFAYRNRSRFEPWAHGLLGMEHFNINVASGKSTSIAWVAGGGLDYRFDSGFALRAQWDYLGTRFAGVYQRNHQIITGIVWNF